MGPKTDKSKKSPLHKHHYVNKSQSNQPSNASNTPQPTEILTNQNLPNLAASAAALPLLQQINSTSTDANIDTSHPEAMDISNSVSPQASQPALQINSSSSSVASIFPQQMSQAVNTYVRLIQA